MLEESGCKQNYSNIYMWLQRKYICSRGVLTLLLITTSN
ncbi:hypothetical protein BbiDN127_I0011 (plasmid) [Borreliella bissettiae DN127]|uniref:Uncharacterized protein n=1 Tax=Borrelia bissettiae (strain DSM 17990 / CIP 109136 / DN127) TaxID=521010 RepID=G0AP70_BORBD|nr:hypothetical protein BbiDN127_I0011 [Borreliella bissettiae DN127]